MQVLSDLSKKEALSSFLPIQLQNTYSTDRAVGVQNQVRKIATAHLQSSAVCRADFVPYSNQPHDLIVVQEVTRNPHNNLDQSIGAYVASWVSQCFSILPRRLP